MTQATPRIEGGFGVILISVLLGLNVLSTMLLAELPGGNLVNYGATGLFLLSVIVVGMFLRKQVWIGSEWVILIVWLCYSIIPALLSADVESAMFKVLTVLQLGVWALAIHQAIIWRRSAVAPLLMYGTAVTGAYFLSFTSIGGGGGISDNPDAVERVASTLVNANVFGASAVMGLGLCLIAAANRLPLRLKLFQAVLALALIAGVVNSGSRTALIGMIFLLLGSTWALRFWNIRQLMRIMPSLLVFSVIGGAVYYVFKDVPEVAERVDGVFSLEDPNSVFSRLWDFFGVIAAGSLQAEESGESMSQRFDLIKLGIDMMLDSNLLGIGLDNFRVQVGAYSHSNVIEVLVATGVLGLLLYYSIYLALILRCFQILRLDRNHGVARMALVALMTLSLMDIQHVSYDTKQGWLFLAILIASVEVSRRRLLESVREAALEKQSAHEDATDQAHAADSLPSERSGMQAIGSIEAASAVNLKVGKRVSLAAASRLGDPKRPS